MEKSTDKNDLDTEMELANKAAQSMIDTIKSFMREGFSFEESLALLRIMLKVDK